MLARMPSAFGLTVRPETAYVTVGSVVYGSIWGSYLPIMNKYVDNGRLGERPARSRWRSGAAIVSLI
ncbi:hypothetical protein ACLQ29_32475 [Micromonospora sp. DT228]|uniref:hypothetical protein n=1 Tax=Micromonospora sp. DT228 TaxID=3393443 RepID=UPI003CF9E430